MCLMVVVFLQAICVGPETLQVMYPAIFEQLLQFVEFSCKPPQYGKMETKHVANAKYSQVSVLFPLHITYYAVILHKIIAITFDYMDLYLHQDLCKVVFEEKQELYK